MNDSDENEKLIRLNFVIPDEFLHRYLDQRNVFVRDYLQTFSFRIPFKRIQIENATWIHQSSYWCKETDVFLFF